MRSDHSLGALKGLGTAYTSKEMHPKESTSRRVVPTVLRMLLGVFLGLLFVFCLFVVLNRIGLPRIRVSSLWAAIGLSLLAYFLAVAIHEAGHLLATLAVKMRVYVLALGPVTVFRSAAGRLNVQWLWRFFAAGFTGCVFPDGVFRPRQMALVLAAGPLASLFLGLASFLVLYREPAVSEPSLVTAWFPSISFLLAALGCNALGHFVVSMLPLSLGNPVCLTDGGQLLDLWRESPGLAQWRAIRTVSHLSIAGVRPRDWPKSAAADFENPAGRDDIEALSAFHAFIYAWDACPASEAERHFEGCVKFFPKLPAIYRPGVRVTCAFYEAWVRKDASAARSWLKGAEGPFLDAYHAKKVDAALALLDGDRSAALAAVHAGKALMSRARVSVTGDDHDHFDWLLAAAEQGLPSTVSGA